MGASSDGDRYDALIIGCGMAGLAAGIRLALFDKRVLILEKHNAPGGLNSFYFQGGRKFDVGLHAVTNCAEPGTKGAPLSKLCRQLRIPREAFGLSPQIGSRIAFPGIDLRFTNDFGVLEADVAAAFPRQIDGFRKLREAVLAFDALDLSVEQISAREVVRRYLTDPVLEDMLFCPLMYYGSARERDMDFDQYVTLWRALFEEGLGRPLGGVRVIIRALLDQYRSLGGKRRMRCGVSRILTENDRAVGVLTDSGETLYADRILSTAGSVETALLCRGDEQREALLEQVGRLSFAEAIAVLSRQPADLGIEDTIVFFNDSERFEYVQSRENIDTRSGVICFPNNYAYADGGLLEDGFMRVTSLASHALWTGYDASTYRREKERCYPLMMERALRFLPSLDPDLLAQLTVQTDIFTPRTVEKFTSHLGGAVYGAPRKQRDGKTGYANLYLAGTDQGFLGIVGAMLSGISMANRHFLA